eukprot:COSAG02_NODE_3092_length_7386_cov_2.686428_3_plen_327_part_00
MLLSLVLAALVALPGLGAASCDLSGVWRAVENDPHSVYKFEQHGTSLVVQLVPRESQAQTASEHWQHCSGNISASGAVVLQTDTGNTLTCSVASNCSALPWSHGPAWCRVGSGACPHPPNPSPPPDAERIKHVHVIAMNHLDIGFSCKGCGSSASDRDSLNTMPAPYTWQLLNFYMNEAFPMAINTSKVLAQRSSTAPNAGSYVYTTHCWLVSFFLDCPAHWTNLQCPSAELVAAFRDAVSKGATAWHNNCRRFAFVQQISIHRSLNHSAGVRAQDGSRGMHFLTTVSQNHSTRSCLVTAWACVTSLTTNSISRIQRSCPSATFLE